MGNHPNLLHGEPVRWAPRCQVWGAIGVGWKHLVILDSDSSIRSSSIIETLKKVPFPQKGGATAHTAHASKEYITNRMKDVLKNCPPPIHQTFPIENVWSILAFIYMYKPLLIRCVQKAWSRLPQNVNTLSTIRY